jgi:hypothetical protein
VLSAEVVVVVVVAIMLMILLVAVFVVVVVVVVKVKRASYKLRGSPISRQSAHESGKVSFPHRPPLASGNIYFC